ncbi:alanine--tRNA ligase [Mycoplasmopsis lipofaciens]|uniref:alanine--tRNA ligase n=1 Tax=Mycoplasmopsis lipofaciens TaxID=114884 RepID=UPI000482ED78|nr:alanine--tRNA ligase [Mycoplasmopsis lipofaciens]
MNSKEIRNKWLSFFESKGHLIVESKSLIPIKDSSLLWINSGVATLKDYFSGKKIPPKNRLTNSQKAIRTNDIENVGITSRHHTFFEMLGNFSIGDYFKKEAISYAREFLIDVLKLDKSKLYFTYYEEDLETKEYWIQEGFDETHLIKGTRKTNFWDVGSGPCGPDTEIFYDRGEKYDKRGIELLQNDIENDRYIEIWNIVFSQFNNDGENNYTELKQKNIDTGAGLERIAAIMQDVPTNYDSDLFINIIHEIEKYTEYKYDVNNYFTNDLEQKEINTYFKVIADHIRTVVNAIADGAKISNIGRGYIIRRLIRRSIYKGMQLKINQLFLYNLVQVVKDSLPFEYNVKKVSKMIKEEEILFNKTIENGKLLLEKNIDVNKNVFSGEIAFNLLETYGFPIELTIEILANKNIAIDMDEFEQAKQKHIEISRGKKIAGMDKVINSLALIKSKESEFIGYDYLENKKAKIVRLLDNENEIKKLNGIGYLVLDKTPFYATSGGQNHDHGILIQGNNEIELLDVFKDKYGNHIHKVNGIIDSNKIIECYVDKDKRLNFARNHSATHLVFRALREIYGHEVEQMGSDITYERFTFDFPADSKPNEEQIRQIETIMRNYIARDLKREYIITTIDEAKKMNAIMTIEENEYADANNVRVVKWEDATTDLCGGTHLPNSKLLENFKITSVDKKASGVYRIRAVTSNKLVNKFLITQNASYLEELNNIINKTKIINKKYNLEIKYDENNLEKGNLELWNLILQAREDYKKALKNQQEIEFNYENLNFEIINNKEFYFNSNINASQIKVIASTIREKYPNSYVFLTSKSDKQILLAVATKKEDSNKLFQKIATKLNGRGGGSPIIAMGKVDNKGNILDIIKEILNA